ncbi:MULTISPECIES: HEPN domain-containing protein [Thermococcus]|uniref:HEPN domain-containing protein n=1 Tax=Thermococcus waiotapuensis TaxID=90909 RepID=A0AAE4NT28_9EURY|nr:MULTISPECIES: HEPN domain-containing protein [Thermococcus]MDV3103349.1 HEPN domain-containing protein [Thermococcus waiotapuensis]
MPSKEKGLLSIKRAEEWLSEARKTLGFGSYRSSLIASYMAMFHAARALLFKDGWREKSHYCIARYLDEFYVKTGKLDGSWVELLDRMRELRHEDQYDIVYTPEAEEAEEALEIAGKFIDVVKKLLEELE